MFVKHAVVPPTHSMWHITPEKHFSTHVTPKFLTIGLFQSSEAIPVAKLVQARTVQRPFLCGPHGQRTAACCSPWCQHWTATGCQTCRPETRRYYSVTRRPLGGSRAAETMNEAPILVRLHLGHYQPQHTVVIASVGRLNPPSGGWGRGHCGNMQRFCTKTKPILCAVQ